jgi:hypothetical protein
MTEDGRKVESLSPIQAIELFSNSQGSALLYRGMALTTEEAQSIKATGILAPALRKKREAKQAIKTLIDPTIDENNVNDQYPVSFSTDLVAFRIIHYSDTDRRKSISISTSKDKEVAASIGWHNSGREANSNLFPWVFTIRVPKLSTYQELEMTGEWRNPHRRGLEIFIPFGVLPSQIERAEQIEIPPKWSL